MPRSESCLVLNVAARNTCIRRNPGMGMNSLESVNEFGSVHRPKRASEKSLRSMSEKHSMPSVQLIEESKRSEFRKTKESLKANDIVQKASPSADIDSRPPKRKLGGLQRSGPVLEVDHSDENVDGSSGPSSSETKLTLPQHEQIHGVEPLDISYCCTPASMKLKGVLVSRMVEVATLGRIQVIDLSRRGLGDADAEAISIALRNNPQLAVLKLGYNSLGDNGASVIASTCSKDGSHHRSLAVLDLGFNCIGDDGCVALSVHMIAGNHTLRNLFLSGNNCKKQGAMAIAGALLHGCSLTRLHLSANNLGTEGIKVITGAIAEMDKRRQHLLLQQGGVKTSAQPAALEELFLGDVGMKAQGIVALSNVVLSNTGLRVLDLGNNGIDDRDLALLSQTLAQNKNIPLRSLLLSFNKITCVGVECLMNAIWGSNTLKELKLDNNKMQDRGAQLCSVVLGSISLEVLDISFNRISTVGIKALMKNLSENESLKILSLSGIPMDQNASKAVSYALAYNSSLEFLSIYSCCVGYSGQRHIVAGIVSNRNVMLRSFAGFLLGPITVTLGLPQVPEDWDNDRVLGFVRFMWSHWHAQNASEAFTTGPRGPAPPSSVAAAAKSAFASLSVSDSARIQFQQQQALQIDESPIIDPDTAILVRSKSGQNLQIPSWGEELRNVENIECGGNESWSETDSYDRSSYTESFTSSQSIASTFITKRRNKNLQWLRNHFQALNEVGNMVFNNADLWQLHQHFFSPAYDPSDSSAASNEDGSTTASSPSTAVPSEPTNRSNSMGRAISFQTLHTAVEAAANETDASRPNKRGSLGDEMTRAVEPCAKRAKNLKPRIAYFPRIREKLESLGTKPSAQTLSLFRQLKYVESMMLQGKNIYVESGGDDKDDETLNAADVEMVLLDLL